MSLKIAYSCLFVLCLLLYFCAILVRITGKYNIKEDNISPARFFCSKHWNHQKAQLCSKNSFEVLIVFAIAFFCGIAQ